MKKKKMVRYYKKLEQRSQEWFQIREGVTSGTDMKVALSKGVGQKTLIYKKIASKYIDDSFLPLDLDFCDPHLEQKIRNGIELSGRDFANRGVELEPYVISLYEKKSRHTVHEMGFVKLDDYIGLSPDGLIRDSSKYIGAIEIKCLLSLNHLKLIDGGFMNSEHKAQVLNYFVCIETLEWVDCIAYHPGASDTIGQMYIERVYREDVQEEIAKQCEKLSLYIQSMGEAEGELLSKFKTNKNAMITIQENKLYNIQDVAKYLDMSAQTIRAWCKSGRLVSKNVGTEKRANYRILGSDILQLTENR